MVDGIAVEDALGIDMAAGIADFRNSGIDVRAGLQSVYQVINSLKHVRSASREKLGTRHVGLHAEMIAYRHRVHNGVPVIAHTRSARGIEHIRRTLSRSPGK